MTLSKRLKTHKRLKSVPTSRPINKRPPLIITDQIEQWLYTNPELVVETEAERQLLVELMSPSPNQVRHGRFGASSRGQCKRRQVFKYLGMPAGSFIDPRLQNIFNDGKFRHIRWQLMLLKAGLIDEAEGKFKKSGYRLSVSLDGVKHGEYFVEVKGMRTYANTMTEIDHKHMLQIHSCMLASGLDTAIYLPEDKGTNDWREVVVYQDDQIMDEVITELGKLNTAINDEVLPSVKAECKKKIGEYADCEFSAWCLRHEAKGDHWPEDSQWDPVTIKKKPRKKS